MIHLLVLKWLHNDSDFELIVHCDKNLGSVASLIISFCLCQMVSCYTYLYELRSTYKRFARVFSNVACRSFNIHMERMSPDGPVLADNLGVSEALWREHWEISGYEGWALKGKRLNMFKLLYFGGNEVFKKTSAWKSRVI